MSLPRASRPGAAPRSAPPAAQPARTYLGPLQGLRFFAALHVVLLHTFRTGWLPPAVERLASWGASTASLFFLLSGFVLAYAYTGPDGTLRIPARELWWRRFARLYPLALLCHLATVPLVWEAYGPVERWLRAGATVAGVQAWFPPLSNSFDSPGWSLSYLALGYLLLPWVLRRTAGWTPRRWVAALGALWIAMLVPAGVYTAAGAPGGAWLAAAYTFPLVRLPEFLFGVGLARLFTARAWPRPPAWVAPASLAALAGTLVLTPEPLFHLNHNGLWAPLHGLLVWSLAAGGGWIARALSSPRSQRLGETSFAVYLLHVPLFAWLTVLLGPRLAAWGAAETAAFYAGYLALTVALSFAAERWIVEPVATWVRDRRARGRASPAPAPA